MILIEASNLLKFNKGIFTCCVIKSFSIWNVSRCPYPSYSDNVPKLSPVEVTRVLSKLEYSHEFAAGGPIKTYDTNQLGSNYPIEDVRAEAVSLHDGGIYMGIFDGHVGPACAQVLAKRLFNYVEAAMLPKDKLQNIIESHNVQIVENFNDNSDFVSELKEKYEKSFFEHVDILLKLPTMGKKEAMEYAILKLDDDMSSEGEQEDGEADRKGMTVCMSGAVACLAYISSSELYLASVGDCQAVLGVLSDSKKWTAKKLSIEHSTDNPDEVNRILGEHPVDERNTVIAKGRLLSQLAPLRAFGDVRYKWSKEKLAKLAAPLFGENSIPPDYYTPPYLTAKPDITRHRLTPRDKFLVIGSDGLWEFLSPLQVVRMVGEHMRGKAALAPLRIPQNMKLKDINSILIARREGLNNAPVDRNAATHLIRNALGGTDFGLEHSRISQHLSWPQSTVRLFRDDITIAVAYFDSEFVSQCPM